MQRGFSHVKVYPAGIRFYRQTHADKEEMYEAENGTQAGSLAEQRGVVASEPNRRKISIDNFTKYTFHFITKIIISYRDN